MCLFLAGHRDAPPPRDEPELWVAHRKTASNPFCPLARTCAVSREQVGQKGACPFVAATVYEEDEARPLPKRNKHGELVFADAPDFRPNLTPQQVIEVGPFACPFSRHQAQCSCCFACVVYLILTVRISLSSLYFDTCCCQAGAFGGGYFRDITSRVTGRRYKDAWKEFPKEWFANVNISQSVSHAAAFHVQGCQYLVCGSSKRALTHCFVFASCSVVVCLFCLLWGLLH